MSGRQNKNQNRGTGAENGQTPVEDAVADDEAQADQTLSDQQKNAAADGTSDDVGSDIPVEARLEAALADIEKFRDVALRAEAEMQNVRRRAGRDVENAHRYALERFVNNLLPVVDSLDKALESIEQTEVADDATRAIAEGVGLCQKMFVDVLVKEGVSVVDPVGEPFDPNLHQAMSMVENPDVEPNSVVAVIQRGYTLNDRLVRPAMVMVSKASESKA